MLLKITLTGSLLTRLMANIETAAAAITAHWIVLQRRRNTPLTQAHLEHMHMHKQSKTFILPERHLMDIVSQQTIGKLSPNTHLNMAVMISHVRDSTPIQILGTVTVFRKPLNSK